MLRFASQSVVVVLRLYQRWLSGWLPPACRFTPTCSEYARQCFLKYGFRTAAWRSLRRLLRCHPLHPGGIDLP